MDAVVQVLDEVVGQQERCVILRLEKTQLLIFSADETVDVGLDNQTPVAEDIGIGSYETRFTSKIHKITLAVKAVN